MQLSMYEYSYFDYIVFHVRIENENKCSHKKKISGNSQNFIELLPTACPAPEIKILSVLVKFSLKAEIELSS